MKPLVCREHPKTKLICPLCLAEKLEAKDKERRRRERCAAQSPVKRRKLRKAA